jgi:hypothetical protein
MEFELYTRANSFVEEEIIKRNLRVSKTRLENLSRALGDSYSTFEKVLNSYLLRLQREAQDGPQTRSGAVRAELELLNKIKAQCGPDILRGLPLEQESKLSRSERKELAERKRGYMGRLTQAWFTHFASAYMYSVRLIEDTPGR